MANIDFAGQVIFLRVIFKNGSVQFGLDMFWPEDFRVWNKFSCCLEVKYFCIPFSSIGCLKCWYG